MLVTNAKNLTRRDRGGFRNDSSVQLNFVFKRQTGFFLLQVLTYYKSTGKLLRLTIQLDIVDLHPHNLKCNGNIVLYSTDNPIVDLHSTYPDRLLLLGFFLAGQDGEGRRGASEVR